MFNIWKQAWRGIDSKTNTNETTSPDAQEEYILGESAATLLLKDDSKGRKHPRNEDEFTDVEQNKRPKYDTPMDDDLKKDSVANYLPEVLAKPPLQNNQVDRPTIKSTLEEILERTLTWTVEQERLRRKQGFSNRVALLIVASDSSLDERPLVLEKLQGFNTLMCLETICDCDSGQNLMKEDLIVMPANVFLSSLVRGGLLLCQANVLILEDVDMVGDAHPIARVMSEFYNSSPREERPRIFGIISSNTDSAISYDIGMLKLEKLLDATVVGVPPELRIAVMALPDTPTELVVFYDPHFNLGRVDTPLLRQLRQVSSTVEYFKKQFKGARYVAYELGTCASDLVWRKALREMEKQTDLYLEEDDDDDERDIKQQDSVSRSALKVKKKVYSIIKNWIFALPNLDHTSRGYNVTPKLVKLVQTLKAFEPQGENFRGIIFVHRRVVAYALCDTLRVLGDYLGFVRPQVITGHGSITDPYVQLGALMGSKARSSGRFSNWHNQRFDSNQVCGRLRNTTLHLCYKSQVSYAYSRARSRGSESHLIHMAERGNDVHRRILSEISMLDNSMQKWIESITENPESSVPPSVLKETSDPYRSDSDDDEEGDFVQDPTASGRIYAHDATTVLYRFLATFLSNDHEVTTRRPLFEFQQLRGHGARNMHICTVLMPSGFPIKTISGPPYPIPSAARRAACLRTCEELFNRGYLDYKLFPRPPSVTVRQQRVGYVSSSMVEDITDDEDDALQHKQKASGTRTYSSRKPDFWTNTSNLFNGRLYPTVIDIDFGTKATGEYGSLLFLTRLPLPRFNGFRLFLDGVSCNVCLTSAAPFEVDQEQLQLLHKYTLRLCRTISNKPFAASLEETSYFLAPLTSAPKNTKYASQGMWDMPNVSDYIPWESVIAATKNWAVGLRRESTEALNADILDAVIQDRWVEFTRRYYTVSLRLDLNPMSKPEDSSRESSYDNFFEYCKARRRGFEGLEDYSQPLIEVDRVPAITNLLNPTFRVPNVGSKRASAKYLIPELCCKLTIPASIIRTALLLPSITRRLDDILLVKELNAKLFDHCISESLLHEAISTPSVSVEYDYERLELLGDAYLKYLSSVYLFVTQPSLHEGALHIARQRIISNRSLLKNADRSGLPQYIQSKPFASKAWLPSNFKVFRPPRPIILDDEFPEEEAEDGAVQEEIKVTDRGDHAVNMKNLSETIEEVKSQKSKDTRPPENEVPGIKETKKKQDDSGTQKLGDKAVADVAEAIIGAAYITSGREVALKVAKALNVPVPHIDRWTDFARKTLAPPPEAFAPLKSGTVEHIEKAIGHPFRRPHLLAQALTHASIQGHETTSYERLEFIGDAILDFCSSHIYLLSQSAMVSNSTLAAVCVYSEFHEYLIFESQAIASSINQYSDALRNAQRADEARAKLEGRMPGQYWLDIEPPKVLSDVLESVMGAVYVSDNFSPVGVEALFDNVLKPFFDKHITLKTLSYHPTKVLFELFQSRGCQEFLIDKYLDPEKPGLVTCDVVCHDIILATADDPATQFAARKASFLALDALEGDTNFLNTTCSCRNLNDAKKKMKKMQQQKQMAELEAFEDECKTKKES
ncbi:hypothetical protein Clacol_001708 [Clathrus columnatus]|uniref:Uncharacterized protein n=1 Tax=Clathrus columnatus TaxID=1419009 RepID=A0AAV5A4I1_9AGAM|nr:hypothetical protein Clacol_001708 [Clathrus columnatus]